MSDTQILIAVLVALVAAFFIYKHKKKPVDIELPVPEKLRTDLFYGYYGCMDDQVEKTKGQVNLLWECQFQGHIKAADNILEAKLPTVIDVANQVMHRFADSGRNFEINPKAEENLRGLFNYLRLRGALQYVIGLTPVDEPNTNARSEKDLMDAITITRAVAAEYEELKDVKLAVIYAAKPVPFPCLDQFDWVGVDDYEELSQIFVNGTYAELRKTTNKNQRTIILPGGGFGQNPEPFIRFAHLNPEVAAVVPFVYFGPMQPADTWVGIGDDRNPLKGAYEAAGKALIES